MSTPANIWLSGGQLIARATDTSWPAVLNRVGQSLTTGGKRRNSDEHAESIAELGFTR